MEDEHVINVEWDHDEDGDYEKLISKFRTTLLTYDDRAVDDLPPLLRPQKHATAPARWMYIKLISGGKETTLAVRDDNVYLWGFRNQKGKWYEFGFDDDDNKSVRLLPNSTFLGFDGRYRDFVDQGETLNVQSSSITSAICCLAKYGAEDAGKAKSNKERKNLKKCLVMVIVMVCESARMETHLKMARGIWPSSRTGGEIKINDKLFTYYIRNWSKISEEILKKSVWSPILDIGSRDRALKIVKLILNTREGDEEDGGGGPQHMEQDPPPEGQPEEDEQEEQPPPPPAGSGGGGGGGGQAPSQHQRRQTAPQQGHHSYHGRPMLEVFALLAGAGDDSRPVGTIAIFDGRRGQIIYRDQEHGDDAPRPRIKRDSQGDLVLTVTGPYRAIAADGCVAVEYSSRSCADVVVGRNTTTTLLWDPYDAKNTQGQFQYDRILTKPVEGTEEGRHRLQMSYAVLRRAMEATVQVDVLLSSGCDTTSVHGEIAAHYTQLISKDGGKGILLFRRDTEEPLKLVRSFAGHTIPLSRSVLAWSCGSPLVIKVNLQATSQEGTSTRSTTIPSQGRLLGFCFDDHAEDRIHLSPLQGIGYVRVSVNVTGGNKQTMRSKLQMDLGDPVETDLLVIHPRQLRFTFDSNKRWMHCLLHITNDTDDERVAFRLRPGKESPGYYNRSYYSPTGAEVSGILPPNTTWTYLVRLQPQQEPLVNMDMILQSCVADEDNVGKIFQRAIEEKQEIDETTLKAIVCHPADQPMTSSDKPIIQHGIKFIPGKPEVIDLHPTEPWILAYAHEPPYDGRIHIWNYETMAEIASTEIKALICSIKFIAREPWFIAGDFEGYIHVYTWGTTMEKVQVEKVKAHEGGVTSLAVHPSEPLVLSASDDYKKLRIKLWNWEAGWKCTQTFEAPHWDPWPTREAIKFNPNDGNAFACTSRGAVEMWKISPPEHVATLPHGLLNDPVCFDYFSTGGDQVYMVTGSLQGNAHIWDLRNNSCITRDPGLQKRMLWNAGVVQSHLGRPILVTASWDHAISLYDCVTYRCERTIHLKLGPVLDVQYSKSTQSLVINCKEGCAVMAI